MPTPDVTRVCVLKTGREYQPIHVQWLARQIPGLVCITDDSVPGVPTVKPSGNWPKWWSKIAAFDPDLIPGDLLYFDLDTVVLGDTDALASIGATTMLSDFYRPDLLASGLMYISQQDKAKAWGEWMRDPAGHMARCTTRRLWGDGGFLSIVLKPLRWQQVMPGRVVSYKVNCNAGVPDGADAICFHGKPRPWQSEAAWVPPLNV